MARKTPSRLELRKQAEAAAAQGGAEAKEGKKAKKDVKKKPVRRTKAKATERKRLMWAVFNSNMKEEGRFPYDQRQAAEERIEQLKLKSAKKLFFIQPVKEVITEALAAEKKE
ncbi:MAG: hypothetical protein AB7O26_18435 [Planctomycetaceae bacterium]